MIKKKQANTRSIVQISSTMGGGNVVLSALCDDGTVFVIDVLNPLLGQKWERCPPIPQPVIPRAD